MSTVLLTILSLVSYIAGIAILLYSTPRTIRRQYDEWMFMLFAAVDIVGGLLVFAAVGVTYALFNANLDVRIFDLMLLAVIIFISLRLAYRCFRPSSSPDPLYNVSVVKLSSILAGSYYILLIAAALYALVMIIAMPS